MSIDLSGKVVIVTGGAKGIGEGCVQKFLDANATVVSLDLDDSALKNQKSKYEKLENPKNVKIFLRQVQYFFVKQTVFAIVTVNKSFYVFLLPRRSEVAGRGRIRPRLFCVERPVGC